MTSPTRGTGLSIVKVPYTAVVLVPPKEIWEPIQIIRRAHDPHVARWMPHVTMLYPFVPAAELERASEVLADVCAAAPAFDVSLSHFRWFEHGVWATVWLTPAPPEPIVELEAQLQKRLPWCDDAGLFPEGFTPHLSVGRWPVAGVRGAITRLRSSWEPLAWHVDHVCLIARPETKEGAFAVRHSLPLGPAVSAPPERPSPPSASSPAP